MHLPDGFIDAPTAVATAGGSLVVVAYAMRRAGRLMGERTVPLLGVTAAFIFAAQMLNFPVAAGTSGHFVGAAFAAVVLGPWAAIVVMTVVVAVQAVGMADGGITALGANVLNMGVVAVLAGYLVHRALRRILPHSATGYLTSVGVAAWASVVISAALTSVELAVSGTVPLHLALPAMASVHAVIGLGEAVITITVLATVLASRPDLVRSGPLAGRIPGSRPHAHGTPGDDMAVREATDPTDDATGRPAGDATGDATTTRRRPWGFLAVALAIAVTLAVVVSPFASRAPDGLESVAEAQGFAQAGTGGWNLSPVADYRLPGISDSGLATALAGAAGTIALFAIVLLLGRSLSGRRTRVVAPPAGALHPLGGHEHTDHRHAGHSHAGHTHSTEVPEDREPHHSHTGAP
ncbi:MAG TPA: energy-coupling factor ABC transporter permease [Thermoleophilia bacterium]|nr:energy-coupling factor ABC transporter permease [Thermoleophilia bacterium]